MVVLFSHLLLVFFTISCIFHQIVRATPNLIVHYTFDSGTIISNQVQDVSGNLRNGAIYRGSGSASISTSVVAYGTGSLQLSNAYIKVPSFGLSNNGFTATFFMKTSSSGWAKVFDFGNGPASDSLAFSPQNGPSLYVGSNSYDTYQPSGLNDNQWHFIAWKVSPSGYWKIFVDDNLVYNSYRAAPSSITRFSNFIGWSNWDFDPKITGYIDDFRFYDGQLDDYEISSINQYSNLHVPDFLAYYKFDRYDFDSYDRTYQNYLPSGTTPSGSLRGSYRATISTTDYALGTGSVYLEEAYVEDVRYYSFSPNGITFSLFFKTLSPGWSKVFDFGDSISMNNIAYSPAKGLKALNGYTDYANGEVKGYNDGKWHHFALVITSDGWWTIYMDKKQVFNKFLFYPATTSRSYKRIGGSIDPTDPAFTGHIDDFRVYSGALMKSQVVDIYDSYNPSDNTGGGSGSSSSSNSTSKSGLNLSIVVPVAIVAFIVLLSCCCSRAVLQSCQPGMSTSTAAPIAVATVASQPAAIQMTTVGGSYVPLAQAVPSAPPMAEAITSSTGVESYSQSNGVTVVRFGNQSMSV